MEKITNLIIVLSLLGCSNTVTLKTAVPVKFENKTKPSQLEFKSSNINFQHSQKIEPNKPDVKIVETQNFASKENQINLPPEIKSLSKDTPILEPINPKPQNENNPPVPPFSKRELLEFDSSETVIPTLSITDIIRTDTNQSIVGLNAPGSLTYFPSNPVKLKITGNNFSDPTEPQKWDFYLVQYDPDVLIETFIKKPIKKKVLIDDCIVLQPDPNGVFSQNELNVIFDSKGVLDSTLIGLHSLKVYDGQKNAEVKVKFEKPDKKYNLQPIIENITLMDSTSSPTKEDPNSTGKYKSIELTGKNYFIDYKRNWVQVESKISYIHKVKVLKDGKMKAELHLPPEFVRNEGQNTINFATPYGSVFKMF